MLMAHVHTQNFHFFCPFSHSLFCLLVHLARGKVVLAATFKNQFKNKNVTYSKWNIIISQIAIKWRGGGSVEGGKILLFFFCATAVIISCLQSQKSHMFMCNVHQGMQLSELLSRHDLSLTLKFMAKWSFLCRITRIKLNGL